MRSIRDYSKTLPNAYRPFSPYTALKFVELGQAIFPPGVLQALGGHDDLGPWIVEHDGIQKISFTGSLQTGKNIMRSASATLKRLTLEL
jgi:acyl-CoA reductase-like NAD-dependent aldehyde dehydrogenase